MVVDLERVIPVAADLHLDRRGTIDRAERGAFDPGQPRRQRRLLQRLDEPPFACEAFGMFQRERGAPSDLFEQLELAFVVDVRVRTTDDRSIDRAFREERNRHPRTGRRFFVEWPVARVVGDERSPPLAKRRYKL